MNNDNQLKNRFQELSHRSYEKGIPLFSSFLSLDEQSIFHSMKIENALLFGGDEGCERLVAGFEADINDFPIDCILIEPVNMRFADELTHRDFLGSVLALGLKRETLGDIFVSNSRCVLFCLSSVSDFIITELSRVKRTSVKCSLCNGLPENMRASLQESEIIVSSIRLDALVSSVYKLSRGNSELLFKQQKVFVNGRSIEKPSYTPKRGDIISVRGFGRFIFEEEMRTTKKGRSVALVKIFK